MYDKRTALQKKKPAMAFARNCLPADDEDCSAPTESALSDEFSPGQFVAVVEESSTLKQPKVLIGRVLHADQTGKEVSLLWHKHVKGNLYKPEYQGSVWTEPCDSLIPVKMTPSKKFTELYALSTSARTIHKRVFDQ